MNLLINLMCDNELIYKGKNEWINEWMNERMNERIDRELC